MMNRQWELPAGVSDLLPVQAEAAERLRRRLIDIYRHSGYRLVEPPMIQYLDSLLVGSARDLELSTFTLVDQMSGRSLGVRADITPQVARIDAHLVQGNAPARLCYCASALRTVPAGPGASREPIQIGAELYGHAGPEADIEIIDLLLESLQVAAPEGMRIRLDVSDQALIRLLLGRIVGDGEHAATRDALRELFELLGTRDLPALKARLGASSQPDEARAVLALTRCYGPADAVLPKAREALDGHSDALALLDRLSSIVNSPRLARHRDRVEIGVDLIDTRGYQYHTGVTFAAFVPGRAQAIGRGGRYDGVGRIFGRARPATGFTLDLRELIELRDDAVEESVIMAPWSEEPGLMRLIAELRGQGQVVLQQLPGQKGDAFGRRSDRIIVQRDGRWQVENRTE